MDEDIKEMIRETTHQAAEFIKGNKTLSAIVKKGKDEQMTIKDMASLLSDTAVIYAREHNEQFGELFIAELDAVDWQSLIAEV